MKIKIAPIAFCCLVAAVAFGQTKGIAGKWGTEGAATKTAGSTMFDLKVDANNKVTGSIAEYGNPLCGSPDTVEPIDSGMVEGKVATFQTTRPNPCPAPGATGPVVGLQVTWTGTLGDDDSLTYAAAIGGGRGGGRGGAPGGGRGGAPGTGPGGAPGAGGPPAGGAPQAAGAAPAGGPPAGAPRGGAPRGAAPGGGRGGPALSGVMHRL